MGVMCPGIASFEGVVMVRVCVKSIDTNEGWFERVAHRVVGERMISRIRSKSF